MNLLARLIGKGEVRDRLADLDYCRGLPRVESRGNRRKAAGLLWFGLEISEACCLICSA
jgi:hypothetical protein